MRLVHTSVSAGTCPEVSSGTNPSRRKPSLWYRTPSGFYLVREISDRAAQKRKGWAGLTGGSVRVYRADLGRDFLDLMKNRFGEHVREAIAEADAFLAGKVDVLGIQGDVSALLAGVDPVTGEIWPNAPYRTINLSPTGAIGDVKLMWEFMKHNFLPVVGRTYRLTGDERYARAGCDFLSRWLDGTLPEKGVSWIGHVHMCQRIFNWLQWWQLAAPSPHFGEELRTRLLGHIRLHRELLEREYEIPCNNHKLISLSSIILMRLLFEPGAEVDTWSQLLDETTDQLFFQDGGFVEQSTSYHRLSLEGLIVHALVLQNLGFAPSRTVLAAMERSLVYFDEIEMPSGEPPLLGDNSNEIMIVRTSPERFWDMDYLFHLSSVLGIVVPGRPTGAVTATVLWYLGHFDETTFGSILKSTPSAPRSGGVSTQAVHRRNPGVRSFPDSGHYVLREGCSYAFMRSGVFGFHIPDKTWHAHSNCDLLSPILNLEGTDILVDSGTYRYNENDVERKALKSEAFHSTFVVDGKSQARYTSSFTYADWVDAEAEVTGNQLIGVIRRDGLRMQRTVGFESPSIFRISDRFVEENSVSTAATPDAQTTGVKNAQQTDIHTVRWYFCLSPRLAVVHIGEAEVRLHHIGSRTQYALRVLSKQGLAGGLRIEVVPAYVAPEFNQSLPNQHLWIDGAFAGDLQVEWVLERA